MEDERPVCSAKGCREDAEHALVWNNPRLHTAEREKTWVACGDHLAALSRFLDLRGFLRRVEALPAACPGCGASAPAGSCPVCADVRTGAHGSGGDR